MINRLLATGALLGMLVAPVASAQSYRYDGADPINKGPLNVYRRDTLKCGKGWSFPGLIWGDRPVSVCMIKTNKKNVFGGDF